MSGWIAVDWGTSRLRVWRMSDANDVLDAAESDDGISTLGGTGFEAALLALAGDWIEDPAPVVACGMIGSRQGWAETAYRPVPATPLGGPMTRVSGDRLSLAIIPGLSQAAPPDVMRGEETQIAGFLSLDDGFDGVLVLPGTHTKWVHVSAGEIVSFRSFMTGELFALLRTRSTLAPALGEQWSDAAFDEGVAEMISHPERLAAKLFGLRAGHLLEGPGPAAATLSGLLTGSEIAAAKSYWLGRRVVVLGDGQLTEGYTRALGAAGTPVESAPSSDITLAGLAAARGLET